MRSVRQLGLYVQLPWSYDKAIEFLTKSLNIFRELGDRARESTVLGSLGNAFNSLGQHNKAIEFLTKSLNFP